MTAPAEREPPRAPFRYYLPLPVRYADTDMQGHVYFANYLAYFDEAFTGYLHAIGCAPRALLAQGCDFVYADARCQYKGSAHFEDVLQVHARVSRVGNTSVTFEFAIYQASGTAPIVTGTLVVVCVAPGAHTPISAPERLREAVARFEGPASAG